jgi:hypothetical protein
MRERFHVRVGAHRCREGEHGGVDRDAETVSAREQGRGPRAEVDPCAMSREVDPTVGDAAFGVHAARHASAAGVGAADQRVAP